MNYKGFTSKKTIVIFLLLKIIWLTTSTKIKSSKCEEFNRKQRMTYYICKVTDDLIFK